MNVGCNDLTFLVKKIIGRETLHIEKHSISGIFRIIFPCTDPWQLIKTDSFFPGRFIFIEINLIYLKSFLTWKVCKTPLAGGFPRGNFLSLPTRM